MSHRGKHPDDNHYFVAQANISQRMNDAAADMAYLLSRGYADASALQLVGNRYQLHRRQQMALRRMVAAPADVQNRLAKIWQPQPDKPQRLAIDGYNLLIFLEAALSDGFLFQGADTCLRDLSGVHGSYHSVEETPQAIIIAAAGLAKLPISEVCWVFDAPVSNSGRLCTKFREFARQPDFPLPFEWEVRLVNNADAEIIALAQNGWVAVSTDAFILDTVPMWCNLSQQLQTDFIPNASILRFV
jgi:hypothetical protein